MKQIFRIIVLISSFFSISPAIIDQSLTHTTMRVIGNGDALGGALGAGAAEATRPATADADDATQQTVSTIVGAVAGGGTGASVGLDGEKYNRQLHQKEIAWIEDNAQAFADANGMSLEEAMSLLTSAALGMVDDQNNVATQKYIDSKADAINALMQGGTGLTQEQLDNARAYIQGHSVGKGYQEHHRIGVGR